MTSDRQGQHLHRHLQHTGYTRDNSLRKQKGSRDITNPFKSTGEKRDTKVNETITHYFKPTGPRNHEKMTNRKYERKMEENTIHSTISYLVQAFRDNDRPNPTKDEDGELGRIISRIYRAWKNEDPPVKQQKALPICVLREISKMNLTEKQRAITQLVIWAFFFACRSCEYLKVPQAEKTQNGCLAPLEHPVFQRRKRVEPQQPRTRICRLCLDNFRMAKERREDEHSHTSPFGRQTPVSGETMGCPSKTNLGVLRSNSRYKSIGGLEKLPDRAHNLERNKRGSPGRRGFHRI